MTDETKKVDQDTPPGPSVDKAGSTSKDTPKTYTKESQEKAVSDALSESGREKKAISTERDTVSSERDSLKGELASSKEELAALNQRIEELELAGARDDPDLTAAIKARRTTEKTIKEATRKEAEATKELAKVNAALESANKATREAAIAELAKEYKLDAKWLGGLGITDAAKLREIAEKVGTKEPPPPVKGDSGDTIGGDTMPASARGKMKAGFGELHK